MKFSKPPQSKKPFAGVDQIFYNDDLIGVLDGKHSLGCVRVASVKSIRLEERKSFKHPVVGGVLGCCMVGIPVQSILGDPLHLWWLTPNIAAFIFTILTGCYLLWGVLRCRPIQWVVFTLQKSERAFPLRRPLSAEAVKFLQSHFEVTQQALGFPVQFPKAP